MDHEQRQKEVKLWSRRIINAYAEKLHPNVDNELREAYARQVGQRLDAAIALGVSHTV